MPIIVFAGRKGGCGKTTGATNMAVWLAHQNNKGSKVAILDTDPERQSTAFFQLRNEQEGFDLPRIHSEFVTGDIYRTLVSLGNEFDWVVVDTPGLDTLECRKAVGLANIAVFPFKTSLYDLRTIPLADDLIKDVRAVRPEVRAVAYCSETDSGRSGENDRSTAVEWLTKFQDLAVLDGFTAARKAYRTAASMGRGVVEWRDPTAAAEFDSLAREVISHAAASK
jgi:chromosome partitioning protein